VAEKTRIATSAAQGFYCDDTRNRFLYRPRCDCGRLLRQVPVLNFFFEKKPDPAGMHNCIPWRFMDPFGRFGWEGLPVFDHVSKQTPVGPCLSRKERHYLQPGLRHAVPDEPHATEGSLRSDPRVGFETFVRKKRLADDSIRTGVAAEYFRPAMLARRAPVGPAAYGLCEQRPAPGRSPPPRLDDAGPAPGSRGFGGSSGLAFQRPSWRGVTANGFEKWRFAAFAAFAVPAVASKSSSDW